MTINRSHVLQTKILEHALWRYNIFYALFHAVKSIENGHSYYWRALQYPLAPAHDSLVVGGGPQCVQMMRKATNCG